ncbi:lysoplasmalogenase [Streptomyces syringium]|uniref:lysoplasmalogenase n=1 Tax=Streptomyces syringium TaxID=76729 RepID=UPI0033A9DC34
MRGTHPPRALLIAFVAVAVVHLCALAAGVPAVAQITKPVLMPLLAARVVALGGPRLLVAALLFGCGGDTLLQIGGDTVFLLGMGSFAAGHVCYLALFARYGAAGGARTYGLAGAYGVAWLGVVLVLWPDLEAGLRVPVACYSLLLTAMACGATRAGPRAGAGGALFLLSDTLIAGGIADWPQAPAPQFWIMLTYLAAQYLLAQGLSRPQAPDPGGGRAGETEGAGPRGAARPPSRTVRISPGPRPGRRRCRSRRSC